MPSSLLPVGLTRVARVRNPKLATQQNLESMDKTKILAAQSPSSGPSHCSPNSRKLLGKINSSVYTAPRLSCGLTSMGKESGPHEDRPSRVCRHLPVRLAFRTTKQENCKFEASPGYSEIFNSTQFFTCAFQTNT